MEDRQAMNNSAKSESSASTAWLGLLSIYIVMVAHGYLLSFLEPLMKLLQEGLHLTNTQLGLLGGAYFVPNVAMAIAGGLLVDRLGARRSLLLFAGIASTGVILMALSESFWAIFIARCIFGLGGESVLIASLVAITLFCERPGVGLAISLGVAANRLGAFAAVTSSSWAGFLYKGGWRPPAYLAAGISLLMLLSACLQGVSAGRNRRPVLSAGTSQQFDWRDLRGLDRSFWYLAGVCASFYALNFSFRTFAIKYFEDTGGMKLSDAAFVSGVMLLAGIVGTPAVAFFTPTGSRRAQSLAIGSAVAVLAIPLFSTPYPPWIPTLLLGVAMSCVAGVVWALVPAVVPERRVGTALGVMIVLQDLAISTSNVAAGALNDASGKYSAMFLMFLILGVLSVACSLAFASRERAIQLQH
jgi:MFS family permease